MTKLRIMKLVGANLWRVEEFRSFLWFKPKWRTCTTYTFRGYKMPAVFPNYEDAERFCRIRQERLDTQAALNRNRWVAV